MIEIIFKKLLSKISEMEKIMKLFFMIINVINCEISHFAEVEQNLTNNLLLNYKKTASPDYFVNVSFGFYDFQIVGIDEKNQIMTSSYTIGQYWLDSRLEWDVSKFKNLSNIRLPLNFIWKPDTMITNSASGDGFLPQNTEYSYVFISFKGLVEYYARVLATQTRCNLNVRNYPLDTQVCKIALFSWMNPKQVSYSLYDYVNASSLLHNSTIWDVTDISLNTSFSDSDGYSVELKFLIKRKPLYYMINSVFPCLVLSFITLLSFYIPFTNQMTLGIYIHLIFYILF